MLISTQTALDGRFVVGACALLLHTRVYMKFAHVDCKAAYSHCFERNPFCASLILYILSSTWFARMEQRLACLLDAVTSADPAAVVPDAVAGRVVECLSAEIGHCLPVFGGETCFRELLPLQKSCPRCDSHLAKIASAKAVATIVHTGGLVRKDHIPCRCRNKNCDMYGSLIWHNYFVDAGRHFFLGHPQDLKCFMVSSSFGFSIEWLEDFHSRVVRQHASFISESDVIQQRAVRHGQTAWLPVARLRKMISEAWFKWRLLVRGYAYNIPGVAQNPIDIHQGVEDLLKPVLPALQKAFSDAAVASARSANMRRDVIVMDGNAKNRRAVCAALLCGRKQSLSLNKTLRHNCPATPALGHLFCAKHNTDDVAAAPQDLGCGKLMVEESHTHAYPGVRLPNSILMGTSVRQIACLCGKGRQLHEWVANYRMT